MKICLYLQITFSISLENDINLTKSLMSLMFMTNSRLSPDLTIVTIVMLCHFLLMPTSQLYNLSEDVHFNLGDIEEVSN